MILSFVSHLGMSLNLQIYSIFLITFCTHLYMCSLCYELITWQSENKVDIKSTHWNLFCGPLCVICKDSPYKPRRKCFLQLWLQVFQLCYSNILYYHWYMCILILSVIKIYLKSLTVILFSKFSLHLVNFGFI